MNLPRFWFILQQDVDRPIGGVKQFYSVASIISDLGYSVYFVQGTKDFWPSWFPSLNRNFLTISNDNFSFARLNPSIDIVVIPETYLPIMPEVISFNLKVVIFNQNMHYLLGEKLQLDPSFVFRSYSSSNVLSVLTVSDADFSYALDVLPVPPHKIHRIVNAIEDHVFSFSFSRSKLIAYMPRKNSSHSRTVIELIKNQAWFRRSGWSFVPIDNKSLEEVSALLADSSIFLSFGYPEGFGLPLAEALVSGCYVVGYDGIGGSEISDLCRQLDVFVPIAFRDFHAFVKGVNSAIQSYEVGLNTSLPSRLLRASSLVSNKYSKQSMVLSVRQFVESISL